MPIGGDGILSLFASSLFLMPDSDLRLNEHRRGVARAVEENIKGAVAVSDFLAIVEAHFYVGLGVSIEPPAALACVHAPLARLGHLARLSLHEHARADGHEMRVLHADVMALVRRRQGVTNGGRHFLRPLALGASPVFLLLVVPANALLARQLRDGLRLRRALSAGPSPRPRERPTEPKGDQI